MRNYLDYIQIYKKPATTIRHKQKVKHFVRYDEQEAKKAKAEGAITEELLQEVKDTNGLYNPITDTYVVPGTLPEVEVTAEDPLRDATWTSEWTYNDPEFELRLDHILDKAAEIGVDTAKAMDDAGKKTALAGAAIATIPAAIEAAPAVATFMNSPAGTALDAILTADGVRNYLSENGVQKTVKLAKEGDTWGATKSAAGDALDIIGAVGLVAKGIKAGKEIYDASKATEDTISRMKTVAQVIAKDRETAAAAASAAGEVSDAAATSSASRRFLEAGSTGDQFRALTDKVYDEAKVLAKSAGRTEIETDDIIDAIDALNATDPDCASALAALDFDHATVDYNAKGLGLAEELGKNTYYHNPIVERSKVAEIISMGTKSKPIEINLETIGAFYREDVLPRLLRNFKDEGITLTPELEAELTEIVTKPWESVKLEYGYVQPGATGTTWSDRIRFPMGKDIDEPTLTHELHHAYRNKLAKWAEDNGIIISLPTDYKPGLLSTAFNRRHFQFTRPSYLPGELEAEAKFKFKPEDLESLTPTNEQGATAIEVRFKLWDLFRSTYGHNPTVEELDQFIDDLARSGNLFNSLRRTGYGYTFTGSMARGEFDKVMNTMEDAWRHHIEPTNPGFLTTEDWNKFQEIFNDLKAGRTRITPEEELARDLGLPRWLKTNTQKLKDLFISSYFKPTSSTSPATNLAITEIAPALKKVAVGTGVTAGVGSAVEATLNPTVAIPQENMKQGGKLNYLNYSK